jgi:hypothetical protein
MPQCDVCGNEYDKAFEVTMAGNPHVFDSFECAIHRLAPACEHCGCKIVGHGVEAAGHCYCCASCGGWPVKAAVSESGRPDAMDGLRVLGALGAGAALVALGLRRFDHLGFSIAAGGLALLARAATNEPLARTPGALRASSH